VKVHKGNPLGPHSQNSQTNEKRQNPLLKHKASSFSGVNKGSDQISSTGSSRGELRIQKSSSGVLPSSLTDLMKEKSDRFRERKLTSDELESKLPSLTAIGHESIKGAEDVETLNDLQFQTVIFSQTQLCDSGFGNDRKQAKSSSARSQKVLSETTISSDRETKSRGECTKPKSRGNPELYESNLLQNLKATAKLKKSGSRYQSYTKENVGTPIRIDTPTNPIKGSLNKLNQLCDGAMKSTNRLGLKLRQQQAKTGKDFVNLDTLIEKLTYENTIENWEQSVKQADKIDQRSSLFNMNY